MTASVELNCVFNPLSLVWFLRRSVSSSILVLALLLLALQCRSGLFVESFVSHGSTLAPKLQREEDPQFKIHRGGSSTPSREETHRSTAIFQQTTASSSRSSSSSMIEILKSRVVTASGGILHRCQHASTSTGCNMIFSIFLPSSALIQKGVSATNALYWLSGLTCTDENFCQKAPNAFAVAELHNLAIVIPDTSPRGDLVPNKDQYDLGQGAAFYINATLEPWKQQFQMEDYIQRELPTLVESEFQCLSGKKSIFGHSMGGHGALTLALKYPNVWTSVSAFAPICHPTVSPWGMAAFETYLGSVEAGKAHDATELLLASRSSSSSKAAVLPFDDILIDEGTDDEFAISGQLKLSDFENAAHVVQQKITVRRLPGGDHSYHTIAAFIEDHVKFHSQKLRAATAKEDITNNIVVGGGYEYPTEYIGKPITCSAMVARGPKLPMTVETITVDPPKAGEVRVKVIANALCHTDIYTLDGHDPEGLFPCILGHEAGCIVESVGEGVTTVQPGDFVVPCYTPQCAETDCVFCMSPKTNLCPSIRSTQGKGVMPDGSVRFKDASGQNIYHFMGCSTMAEYTVLAEISCAKISKQAILEKVCLFGCGVSTGLGAVLNTCKVEPGASVAVFGLGAVGLAVIQGAKMAGAGRIIAVDINPKKFKMAERLGATDFVNSAALEVPVQQYISGTLTKWGVDYTFDCTGNTQVMRAALECAHRGWGVSCVIGVAAAGHEVSTRPFQLVTGRVWKGTAFGGYKSRTDVPKLVEKHLAGNLPIDHFITHFFQGVDKTNEAIDVLHSGDCLRAVVKY